MPLGARPEIRAFDLLEAIDDEAREVSLAPHEAVDVAHLEDAARRGAYVELDSVGAPYQSQTELLETTIALIEAGFIDHLLLSHDAGWYWVGEPGGGVFRAYTSIFEKFIPALKKGGFTDDDVKQLLVHNPRESLTIKVRKI